MRRGTSRALAAMVAATLLWGATFVVIKGSLASLAPAPLVLLRFAAATAVFALALALRRRAVAREAWVGGAIAGVLAAGGFLFQAIGLERTSAGSSAFLTFAGTSFAALFAWAVLGQRPGARLFAGLTLALAGTALLTLRDGLRAGPGEAWTLAGALCFALQIVAIARWAPRAAPLELAGVQAAALTACLLPWSGAALTAARTLDSGAAWRLGYLIAAGSVLAPMLQVVAQRGLSAGRVGLLFALEPLFALGFAITLGGERFDARWWLGAALILSAVLLPADAAFPRKSTS